MTHTIPVGTPVTVPASSNTYLSNYGMSPDDLVVLYHGTSGGYGIGPRGNDPQKAHSRDGWIYFGASLVTPKPKERTTVTTKFKAGDKVRVTDNGYTLKDWIGVEGVIQHSDSPYNNKIKLTTSPNSLYPVGYVATVGNNLELIQSPALKGLAVGDKVRYNGTLWNNLEGTVSAINGSYIDVLVTKLHDNAFPHTSLEVGKTLTETCGGKGISPSSLEKIEPSFTFADIQVGDTIRRTATYKGATEVREGVVGIKGSYYFANEQGNYILAYDTDGTSSITDVTLELLNRPEPVKEAWETAKAGDRLVVKASNGATRVLTKQKSGEWDTLVITSYGSSHIGFTRTDESLKEDLSSKSFSVDGNHQFVTA